MLQASDLIASLSRQIESTLRPWLADVGDCALVDFPTQANVGDSAIWLGERACLDRAGVRVVATCHIDNYDRDRLARSLRGRGVIVIHGGGNLGDVWTRNQAFREKLIRDFPDCRIIQMPQWLRFEAPQNLKRARSIFNAHPDLVILVRDRQSLDLARNEFKASSLLCPDMAFALGQLRRPTPPSKDLVWLGRSDRESAWPHADQMASEVTRVDWRRDPPAMLNTAMRSIAGFMDRQAWHPLGKWDCRVTVYDAIAKGRLNRGRRLLSTARVVITDRIHGYILCLLMEIPHVLLDTKFGKIRAFWETWASECALTRWACSPEEALAMAQPLSQSPTSWKSRDRSV